VIAAPSTASADFRFGLGDPVLEFVATLARRRAEPIDRLATPSDLSRWLTVAGLTSGPCKRELLDEARTLREAIYRTIHAARTQTEPRSDDRRLINHWARQPTSAPQLEAGRRLLLLSPDPAQAALSQLARDAIELIAGPDLVRVRNCANAECSLMFIDHSRPGRRRWCSMERCGNRAKIARYRHHRRVEDAHR
jgi:predicted RNA-binding Zn ribbon-like protein